MEDFSLDLSSGEKKEQKSPKLLQEAAQELTMQVSGICDKDGEKVAYVTFADGDRTAEGEIPKCVMLKREGFSDEEVRSLEDYMEQNLEMLKSMAAEVNPIKAMMKN